MVPTSVTQGAVGPSSWVPVDNTISPFNIALGCTITSGASLTYGVQYSYDSPFNGQDCTITRSTTTATLILPNHGISSTSDSITVWGSGSSSLDGTFPVASITDANTITYTVTNSGPASAGPFTKVAPMKVFTHATITGKTANADGNIAIPCRAVRLDVTAYTSGKVTLTLLEARK